MINNQPITEQKIDTKLYASMIFYYKGQSFFAFHTLISRNVNISHQRMNDRFYDNINIATRRNNHVTVRKVTVPGMWHDYCI